MKTVNFLIFALIIVLELVTFSKGYNVDEKLTVDSGNTKYGIVTTFSSDFALFVTMDDVLVSTVNDVPAFTDIENVYNMVVLTNSQSNRELMIKTDKELNPITMGNRLDHINSHTLKWNIGFIPQTWENSWGSIIVFEIGGSKTSPGAVVRVKVFAAIDFPVTRSWGVVAIAVHDLKSAPVNNLFNLKEHYPYLDRTFRNWLNVYYHHWKLLDASIARIMITDRHANWKTAIERSEKNVDELNCTNVRLGNVITTVTGEFQSSERNYAPLAPVPQLNEIATRQKGGYCVICLSERSTHACIPCGHKIFCFECSTSAIIKCPICQTNILMIVKIFDKI